MPCRPFRSPDGSAVGFICGGPRPKSCATPGCGGRAVALCDYPVGTGRKTCSRPMCERCRHRVDDLDYCGPHLRADEERRRGQLWQVTTATACFGLVVASGSVVEVAPIGKRLLGQPIESVRQALGECVKRVVTREDVIAAGFE